MLKIPDAIADVLGLTELDLSPVPCVYFLVRGNEVLYVGQTVNLGRRILAHRNVIPFERVFYLDVADVEMGAVERAWIRRLNPPYNRTHVVPDHINRNRRPGSFDVRAWRRARQQEEALNFIGESSSGDGEALP